MVHPLLPMVDEALVKLTEATNVLTDAARWAERDSSGFFPLAVIAAPLKFWKWHKAKKIVREAATLMERLRARTKLAKDLPDVEIEISKLDMVNDMFDLLPFSVARVGEGGVSPIKQRLGVEMTTWQLIETTRTTIDHATSEVGLLHAKLRASRGAAASD